MLKLTLSIFVVVLLTAPTIASDNWDIETRAVSDNHLVDRELSNDEAIVFARDIEELFARLPEGLAQDEGQDLSRRFHISKSFLHKALDVGKTVAGLLLRRGNEKELFAREDSELGARENDHHDAKDHRRTQTSDELITRELYDELYERDFVGWDIDELD